MKYCRSLVHAWIIVYYCPFPFSEQAHLCNQLIGKLELSGHPQIIWSTICAPGHSSSLSPPSLGHLSGALEKQALEVTYPNTVDVWGNKNSTVLQQVALKSDDR